MVGVGVGVIVIIGVGFGCIICELIGGFWCLGGKWGDWGGGLWWGG